MDVRSDGAHGVGAITFLQPFGVAWQTADRAALKREKHLSTSSLPTSLDAKYINNFHKCQNGNWHVFAWAGAHAAHLGLKEHKSGVFVSPSRGDG